MGWRPDLPDFRDHIFDEAQSKSLSASSPTAALPTKTIVPKFKVPVFDQGYLGSCVGNAISTMMSYTRQVAPRSRLQIYYEARRLIGETHLDEGAYIRDGIKVISNLGAGREAWWPYDETKFDVDPPLTVDRDALLRKIFNYSRLLTGDDFKTCLAKGFPFVIGFSVYDIFLGTRTGRFGILPMPRSTEVLRGGHAVCVIGYDMDFRSSDWAKAAIAAGFPAAEIPQSVYIVRNSWSDKWGNKGDFAVDTRYFENPGLASDAWTIRKTKA